MKKFFLKICRLFKTYPSMYLFIEEAKKQKVKIVKIIPRVAIFEHLSGVEVYQGAVEVVAEELPGIYSALCCEVLVKPYDDKEKLFHECEKVVMERAQKIKKKLEEAGLAVEIKKLKVY